MTVLEAVALRHSVRAFDDRTLEEENVKLLEEEISRCNQEGGVHLQLVLSEPKAFKGLLAKIGKFSNAKNYIAVIGAKNDVSEEKCGYFGERVVLLAQGLGLNTCWVAGTYKKIPSAFTMERGEKLFAVIALGYGVTQGNAHKSKLAEEVSAGYGVAPAWFQRGVDCALLAPTAMNKQNFVFTLTDGGVELKSSGVCANLNRGILKTHFEIGADREIKWIES